MEMTTNGGRQKDAGMILPQSPQLSDLLADQARAP